jgi:tyrosinase
MVRVFGKGKHRLNDTLTSLLSGTTTLADMIDVSQFYTYDSLAV